MKLFLPLLGVGILLFLVGRYFWFQLSRDESPVYGDPSRIIPGSMQSSTPPAKAPPLITEADRQAKMKAHEDDFEFSIKEPPALKQGKTRAQKFKGNKADLRRAFMLHWLLKRKH